MEVETFVACIAEKHGVCAFGTVAKSAGKICRHRGRRLLRFSDGSVEDCGEVQGIGASLTIAKAVELALGKV